MDARVIIAMALLCAGSASAQQVHTASGLESQPKHQPRRKQPYNPGATPMRCDQSPDPRLQLLCNDIERAHVQGTAKRQGLPVPSTDVVALPAMGSANAKALGAACVGGTAMRRLSNGWEQLRDNQGHWLRCRDLNE